jgi:signal transduction histidine kinase
MNIFAFTCFLTGIVAGASGLFVFLKGKGRRLNQTWFVFNLAIAIWITGLGETFIVTNENSALFWQRIVYIGTILIPVLFFWFVIVLIEKEREKKISILVKINTLVAIIFLATLFIGNLFIKGIKEQTYFGYWPVETGWLYYPFLTWFAFSAIFAFLLLRKSLKYETDVIKRKQITIVYYGTLIGFGAGSLNFLLDFNIIFPPIHNPFVISYLFFVALAILRYHLFEIKVILTELLVGIMGIILVALPFLMPSLNLKILTTLIFLLFLIFGYYLIKATHEEAKRREEAERLAREKERLAEQFQVVAIQSMAFKRTAEEIAGRERALRKKTERLISAREQFLLSAQHYFRTPLSSLIGLLDLMLTGYYGKEKLPAVLKSAFELRKRIDECLNISQFQLKRPLLDKEEIQLEDLVKEVVKELEIQAKGKDLELKLDLPSKPLPKLNLDKKRMREALSNLIDNAIKHTKRGEIIVGLKLQNEKESILFFVKDTGIGISKDELPYIGTSPFERGRESKKLSPMGKGIGLYLSRLIVEAHGSRLWAESEGKDKGSTFFVELPMK